MQLLGISQLTSRSRRRRGATMVEFALFFIIFLVLSLGLMELGRAVWSYVTLSHAARAAGRYAIVHGGSNPIGGGPSITQVAHENAIGLDSSSVSVVVTYDDGAGIAAPNQQGNVVQVRVSYPFRFVGAGLVVPQSTINMQSTARMIVLN
jgi:Flp pilus assembly protein TadG